LPGKPDLVLTRQEKVIFVHGCFWHNHPNCSRAKLPKTNRFFWKKKVEGNRRRDSRNTRLLRKDRWHVVTVWQCNLRNQERVLKRLNRMIQN
jgi:DNA mismatch endonuclease Vsr